MATEMVLTRSVRRHKRRWFLSGGNVGYRQSRRGHYHWLLLARSAICHVWSVQLRPLPWARSIARAQDDGLRSSSGPIVRLSPFYISIPVRFLRYRTLLTTKFLLYHGRVLSAVLTSEIKRDMLLVLALLNPAPVLGAGTGMASCRLHLRPHHPEVLRHQHSCLGSSTSSQALVHSLQMTALWSTPCVDHLFSEKKYFRYKKTHRARLAHRRQTSFWSRQGVIEIPETSTPPLVGCTCASLILPSRCPLRILSTVSVYQPTSLHCRHCPSSDVCSLQRHSSAAGLNCQFQRASVIATTAHSALVITKFEFGFPADALALNISSGAPPCQHHDFSQPYRHCLFSRWSILLLRSHGVDPGPLGTVRPCPLPWYPGTHS